MGGGLDWITSMQLAWSDSGWLVQQGVAWPGWDVIVEWLRDGYARAPALMLGLGAAVSLPILALIGLVVVRRRAGEASGRAVHSDDVPKTRPASAWRQRAWIEITDGSGRRFDINRDLVRIGREDDNDVQLAHASIHRYHAVIERSPDMIFAIQDLSGPGGGGVLVNGGRAERARLRGGERLDIGGVSLRFHLSAAS